MIRMLASGEFGINPDDETIVRRGTKTQVVIARGAGPHHRACGRSRTPPCDASQRPRPAWRSATTGFCLEGEVAVTLRNRRIDRPERDFGRAPGRPIC
jgi:hypothetical protein